jgi:hypothetical protein
MMMINGLNKVPAVITLDRGFIMIGKLSSFDDHYLIEECYNLRSYNTGCGYGMLRNNKNIILDKFSDLKVPCHSLIHFYEVSEEDFKNITKGF